MYLIYFDSNALFDVLGRRPGVFERVQAAISDRRAQLVVSDTNLIELFGGADRTGFRAEVMRLLALAPKWTVLATLPGRELRSEYARLENRNRSVPFHVLNRWQDFLPLVAEEDERRSMPVGISEPTLDAFVTLYSAGSIRFGLARWRKELAKHQGRIADELVYVGTRRNIFWKTVAHTFQINFGKSAALVDHLWTNPDHAPAFRVDFELTLQDLDKTHPKWTTNNFLDYVHARVLPYVDLFVTGDLPLLRRLQWLDDSVRVPAGVAPFMSKIANGWADAEMRLS